MNKEFIPVMLTPFKQNGEVDYNGLTQLTEFYLQSGAKGLFANCLSSEMYDLNEAERLDVVRHVVKTVNGAVPVVATGTFDKSLAKQADFIKKIYDTGTEAVIIITAMMADKEEGDEVFNQRVFDLFDQTGTIPLGFYECPIPYKRLISAEQLKMFVQTGRITYHKDTCLDLEQVKAKVKAGLGHKFGLYDAYMVNSIESLKAGAAGLSCIQGNYFPKLIVWLCENYYKPELASEVERVHSFFVRNMDVMHDFYPFSAKYCLQKQGLDITTVVRVQSTPFPSAVIDQIDALYNNCQLLEQELQLGVTA
jgi:4-hydroxy-tetrahydrodipicolinate synthase